MSEDAPDVAPETPGAQETPAETDWQAEARKWERRAKESNTKLKEAEPIVTQWRALEEASKTELERKTEELTRWQSEAEKWRTNSIASRVERIAVDDFADPSDALSAIDPSKYLGAGGDIDEAAIRTDLASVLDRKPHWRKTAAAPSGPRVPAPNPAQGSGVNGNAAADPASALAAIIQGQLRS
jgi:hypothetical protein